MYIKQGRKKRKKECMLRKKKREREEDEKNSCNSCRQRRKVTSGSVYLEHVYRHAYVLCWYREEEKAARADISPC